MKTKGTIEIDPSKRHQILNEEDFFKKIFYRYEHNKSIAKDIIDAISNNKNPMVIKDKQGISDNIYYSIIRRLKALGLIYKKNGYYHISKKFSLHTKALADYWEGIRLSYKESLKNQPKIKEEPITDDDEDYL